MIHQIGNAHDSGISSLVIAPDVTTLCSTSINHTAALWDTRSFAKIADLVAHTDSVNGALFLTGGTVVATCSDDRTVLLWDNRQLREPSTIIRGFHDGVNRMIEHEGLLISAADDGQVYIHSLYGTEGALAPEPPMVDRFWVATNTVNDVLVHPSDPTVLLTCSEDCAVRSWRLLLKPDATTDDRLIVSLDEFENPVNHMAVRQNWLFVACSECVFGMDLTVEPTGNTFGSESKVFSHHNDYVRGIEFLSDSVFLTISDDTTCVEWDAVSTLPVRQIKLHDEIVMAMTVRRPSGVLGPPDMLVTGCEGGHIRFWALPFTTETLGVSQRGLDAQVEEEAAK